MRLFVVLLCFGAAGAAAAAKSLDNESIREAVKLWLSDRAAAVDKRCSRRVGEDGVPALEACKQTCGKC